MSEQQQLPEQDQQPWGLEALENDRELRRNFQRRYATRRKNWIENNPYYYSMVNELLQFIVEPGKRVLNLRCQTGFMLDAVKPEYGLGIEITEEMVDIAKELNPGFEYLCADLEELDLDQKFDYIILDSISDTVDVLKALKQIHRHCHPHTRLLIYTYNHIWEPIMKLAESARIKMPLPEQNWLSEIDIRKMLALSEFEHIHTYHYALFPKYIPLLSALANRVLARLPIFRNFCMTKFMLARPLFPPVAKEDLCVSVVIPCKDEQGNIFPAVERTPGLAGRTELLFCDDKSTDDTRKQVLECQQKYPDRDIKLVDGPGINKAANVRAGFEAASGDIVLILDADLTVMPEELHYFVEALLSGRGEFINGSRMVYPMQYGAMKFFNMLGNKFFSVVFSAILTQPVKDTLCGTKVLWRRDWERIKPLVGTWGVEDRWGDYDLLFGAGKLHLKIVDVPVHYQERRMGETKMTRVFGNGLHMLKMCIAGMTRLRFRWK